MNGIDFFTTFIKDRNVGALAKSSKFAVKKISEAFSLEKDVIVVEYGPGDGVITRRLLDGMTPHSKLIVVETNSTFVKRLEKIEDPRLVVFKNTAENTGEILKQLGHEKVDYIVSGIPFTFIPLHNRRKILEATRDSLKADGRFIVYQYSPSMAKFMKYEFGNVRVRFIALNLPSYFLMESVKQ